MIASRSFFKISKIGALCYTRLADAAQEVNDKYTYDRVTKLDPVYSLYLPHPREIGERLFGFAYT